jgi:hypothetical protein
MEIGRKVPGKLYDPENSNNYYSGIDSGMIQNLLDSRTEEEGDCNLGDFACIRAF